MCQNPWKTSGKLSRKLPENQQKTSRKPVENPEHSRKPPDFPSREEDWAAVQRSGTHESEKGEETGEPNGEAAEAEETEKVEGGAETWAETVGQVFLIDVFLVLVCFLFSCFFICL